MPTAPPTFTSQPLDDRTERVTVQVGAVTMTMRVRTNQPPRRPSLAERVAERLRRR